MGHSNWISQAGFISCFDDNPHPSNAEVYGTGMDWDWLRRFIDEVRPDALLTQALGYWGWASYHSKVAPWPKGMKNDYISRFAALCKETETRLGLLIESWQTILGARPFSQAERQRWFVLDEFQERSENVFCPNSPYADEFLIPFCCEVIERFAPAVIWFDHSRTLPCFCAYCEKKFREIHKSPLVKPSNADERTRIEMFSDASLVQAIQRVADVLYSRSPDLVLCWPNVVDTHTFRSPFHGVDWVASDEVNSPNLAIAQYDCTYRSTLGVPAHLWIPDLARFVLPRQRPQEQLFAEASTVLAHGCGLTLYHVPTPVSFLGNAALETAKATSEFVRARAPFCLGNESIPHVGILASRADNLRVPQRFQPNPKELPAIHALLSQNHIPCEVANDDIFIDRLSGYDLVVLPEVGALLPETARALESYVSCGGKLLIVGFAPVVAYPDQMAANKRHLFDLAATMGARVLRHWDIKDNRIIHVGKLVSTSADMEILIRRTDTNGQEKEPLFGKINLGKGEIYWLLSDAITEYAGTFSTDLCDEDSPSAKLSVDEIMARFNFGERQAVSNDSKEIPYASDIEKINYQDRPFRTPQPYPGIPHPHLRKFFGKVVREALGERWLIRSDAPSGVEFVANRRGQDLYIHLVNHTCGYSVNSPDFVTDCIPVLADISFEIKLENPCGKFESLPNNDPLLVERTTLGYKVTLKRLHYHTAVRFADVFNK